MSAQAWAAVCTASNRFCIPAERLGLFGYEPSCILLPEVGSEAEQLKHGCSLATGVMHGHRLCDGLLRVLQPRVLEHIIEGPRATHALAPLSQLSQLCCIPQPGQQYCKLPVLGVQALQL